MVSSELISCPQPCSHHLIWDSFNRSTLNLLIVTNYHLVPMSVLLPRVFHKFMQNKARMFFSLPNHECFLHFNTSSSVKRCSDTGWSWHASPNNQWLDSQLKSLFHLFHTTKQEAVSFIRRLLSHFEGSFYFSTLFCFHANLIAPVHQYLKLKEISFLLYWRLFLMSIFSLFVYLQSFSSIQPILTMLRGAVHYKES